MAVARSLFSIIVRDLLKHNKLFLCLLLLSIASAISVVVVVQKTRQTISEYRDLSKQITKLNIEYLNLQQEENDQSKRERVNKLAVELGLQPVKKEQEVILVK